jgi:hypothetical protein
VELHKDAGKRMKPRVPRTFIAACYCSGDGRG